MDSYLLYILNDWDNYKKYKDLIKDYTISNEMSKYIQILGRYFKVTEEQKALKRFTLFLKTEVKTKTEYEILDLMHQEVLSVSPDDVVLNTVLQHYEDMAIATDVLDLSARFIERDPTVEFHDMEEALRSRISVSASAGPTFITDDLAELEGRTYSGGGLEWRLEWLNRALGPLRQGNFMIVAARVETGKTTFLTSEATFMAKQLPDDKPVLWINNEQPAAEVKARAYTSHTGAAWPRILANKKKYEPSIKSLANKLLINDDDDNNFQHHWDIEKVIRTVQPGLIIFDTLDKVKGFKADRDDLRLEKAYYWARQLAKSYCPVITTSQCDGTAEGQQFIYADQLAGAKTAKQQEADAILTIGRSHDESLANSRYLNIVKNKLQGSAHTEPSLRHGKQEVLLNGDIGRYL